jgi:hypothetical protein
MTIVQKSLLVDHRFVVISNNAIEDMVEVALSPA